MPGFCARIVLAFILGIELFDHVVNVGDPVEPGCGEKAKWGKGLKMGGGGGEKKPPGPKKKKK